MPVASKLSPDDYKGWAQSIEKAGYATGGKYAENLQKIIEQNGLQQYDRQVMQGDGGTRPAVRGGTQSAPDIRECGTWNGGIRFPVEREEFRSLPLRSEHGKTRWTAQSNRCTRAWISAAKATRYWLRRAAARSWR